VNDQNIYYGEKYYPDASIINQGNLQASAWQQKAMLIPSVEECGLVFSVLGQTQTLKKKSICCYSAKHTISRGKD